MILCGIFACNNEEKEIIIPNNILSKEQYKKVLIDFALAESASNLNIKNATGMKIDSIYAFNPLKENNVSKQKYDSTLMFYSKNPKLFKEIHDEILLTLSGMQDARKNSGIKKDSLKKDTLDSH